MNTSLHVRLPIKRQNRAEVNISFASLLPPSHVWREGTRSIYGAPSQTAMPHDQHTSCQPPGHRTCGHLNHPPARAGVTTPCSPCLPRLRCRATTRPGKHLPCRPAQLACKGGEKWNMCRRIAASKYSELQLAPSAQRQARKPPVEVANGQPVKLQENEGSTAPRSRGTIRACGVLSVAGKWARRPALL
jgi:hypothetical protein